MIPFEGSVRKFGKMSHLSATKSLDHKTSIFDDAMENPHCSEITIIPDVAWSRKKATKMEMVGLGWKYGLESGCNDCWDFCICPALHLCTGWPNKSLAPSSTFFSLSSAKVSTRATLNVEKYYAGTLWIACDKQWPLPLPHVHRTFDWQIARLAQACKPSRREVKLPD